MRRKVSVAAGILLLLAATAAQAGVYITQVDFSGDSTIHCYTPGTLYSNTYHTWSWTGSGGTMVDDVTSLEDIHTFGFMTDEDPIFHLVSTVTNSTAFAWSSYVVEIAGVPGVAVGNPSSSPYLTDGQVAADGLRIVYTGAPVPIGGINTFAYDITLPDTGGSITSFTLTLTAVPEPGSLALLGVGACAMLARRRRIA